MAVFVEWVAARFTCSACQQSSTEVLVGCTAGRTATINKEGFNIIR